MTGIFYLIFLILCLSLGVLLGSNFTRAEMINRLDTFCEENGKGIYYTEHGFSINCSNLSERLK